MTGLRPEGKRLGWGRAQPSQGSERPRSGPLPGSGANGGCMDLGSPPPVAPQALRSSAAAEPIPPATPLSATGRYIRGTGRGGARRPVRRPTSASPRAGQARAAFGPGIVIDKGARGASAPLWAACSRSLHHCLPPRRWEPQARGLGPLPDLREPPAAPPSPVREGEAATHALTHTPSSAR